MDELKYREESFAIRGAVFDVYRAMGCGLLEAVYQECLALEMHERGTPHEVQPTLSLTYKGQALRHFYQPDFLCFGKVVVEIKAVRELANEHRAQVHNYLAETGLELGLLVNFGHHPKAQIERIVR